MMAPRRLIGTAYIAKIYGVNPRAISVWRDRGRRSDRPFPEPDTEIETSVQGVYIAGWREDQLPEIEAWKRAMPGQGWNRKVTEGDAPDEG